MKLILVRHGETDQNASGLLMGRADFPLNDVGRQQSERIAARLQKEHIDVIFTSTLQRAATTALTISRHHHGVAVYQLPELLERHFGEFEGRPRKELLAAEQQESDPALFQPTGGESQAQVKQRIIQWFDKMKDEHAEDTVVIVGHGFTLMVLLHQILGDHPHGLEGYRHDNCAVSIIDVSENGIAKTICLLDTTHLK